MDRSVEMLVSTDWLAGHLGDPGIAVVDMRWREDGSARELYRAGHIPGASFLDWSTDLVDPANPVAFMLASPGRFAAAMEGAGIGDDTHAIAYSDQLGSGPFRLWWGSRRYGHGNVSVLDGGLEKWVDEGRPLSAEASTVPPVRWTPLPGGGLAATAGDVLATERDPRAILVDARPAEQYRGESVWFETGQIPADPDGIARTPRGELRAGRVPWAGSLPATDLYRSDHTMKSPGELRAMFESLGGRETSRAITYCGVGIAASAVLFALVRAGVSDVRLYDASWEEWGRDATKPVVRG